MAQYIWEQTGNLGTLIAGEISELGVRLTSSPYNLSYTVVSGSLPPNLLLNRDGTISGTALYSTGVTSTSYNFSVGATDVYGNISTSTSVSVTVNQTTSTEFTSLYCRPLLHPNKRAEINSFLTDQNIFPLESLYRPLDPNFGLQSSLKLFVDFGIKKLSLAEYYSIISRNFYKRRFTLGSPVLAKTANSIGVSRYEVVYLPIIDKYNDPASGQSVPNQLTINGVTYYPAGVDNMRNRIKSQTETTPALDPKFMRYRQSNQTVISKYIKVVPLCYVLPGNGTSIINRIKASGFKFNTIDFEIDRMIVENSFGNNGAKYLLLERNYPLA